MSSGRTGALPAFAYAAYGINILSEVPLALPAANDGALATVECRQVEHDRFREARRAAESLDNFHRLAFLPDGATYLGWDTVGEFIVSAGGETIAFGPSASGSWESFQVYMLGQALSFALVKQRIEPLHATVIEVDGEAVAFLGDSAHGKSSLAACFLHAGHRLLTDDLLVLERRVHREQGFMAHPGPVRIKLFPTVARRFLPLVSSSVRMNSGTEKLVLPLGEQQHCASPIPLAAIYSVTSPRHACRRPNVGIEPLTRRESLMRLLAATFNRRYLPRWRIGWQFETMSAVAGSVPIYALSYPRTIDRLPDVKDQILAHRVGSDAVRIEATA